MITHMAYDETTKGQLLSKLKELRERFPQASFQSLWDQVVKENPELIPPDDGRHMDWPPTTRK